MKVLIRIFDVLAALWLFLSIFLTFFLVSLMVQTYNSSTFPLVRLIPFYLINASPAFVWLGYSLWSHGKPERMTSKHIVTVVIIAIITPMLLFFGLFDTLDALLKV